MLKEISCGGIIFNDKKEILIVKHKEGHYGFPKGHMEEGETFIETAIREIKEETNLEVKIISEEYLVESYYPKENVYKEVYYFLCIPLSNELIKQETELDELIYVPYDKLTDYIIVDSFKSFYKKVVDLLIKNNLI